MKVKRILSYVFGLIIVFLGVILLLTKDVGSIMSGIALILIGIIISPIFDLICNLFNKEFSLGRKIALAIVTFFIAPLLFSSENVTNEHLSTYIFIVIIFWVIMFATNKKQVVDIKNNIITEEINELDIFDRLNNKIIRKRNKQVQDVIDYQNTVKENFCDLDIMTIHAIAKMISESREKHNSVFNSDMPEIDISKLVLSFCEDSQEINDQYELNNLYTKQYYINKIDKYCLDLSNYIKQKIKETISVQNSNRYIELYNNYINTFVDSMKLFTTIKFHRTISSNNQDIGANIFDGDKIDYRYSDSFNYLVDVLATCTCISKMIFIKRKITKLDENNEFYKIISNMSKEIKDVNIIIEKSRPLYYEFYKPLLGFISDDLLYGIAVATLNNRINDKEISKKDEEILDIKEEKITDLSNLDTHMREWILSVAYKYRNLEIIKYILFKITKTINIKDFDLLINSLGRTNEYEKLYYDSVDHNNKASVKERYLKGDFEKEKVELSGKYSLNNITTGTQFELYLVNLFKDLGYKAKHNGKSGDQGADLILRKGDYVYAVQAKYYTGKLSNTPVQEIAGSLKLYNANQGVVITNSKFTQGAEELAKANNVILIDGKGLKKLANYAFEDDHSEDVLKKFE